MTRVGLLAARLFGAITFFVLVFIVYAHIVASRDARQALARAQETTFDSPSTLTSFAPYSVGGASFAIEGDHLHFSGRQTGPTAAIAELTGPSYRLVELRQRVRFRFTDSGGSILTTGLRTTSDTTHAIWLEIAHEGAGRCVVRVAGDAHALGPAPIGNAVLAESEWPCDDAWHEAELRIAPDIARALGAIDGVVMVTPPIGWDDRTSVRSTLGARTRDAHAELGIDVASLDVEPVPIDLGATDVDDRFDGAILDPYWRIERGDPSKIDLALATGKHGLDIQARSLGTSANVDALALLSPTNELGSMTIALDLDVRALAKGAISIGFQNEPGPAWRFADIGILSTGDGAMVPFVSGHFDENGQSRFRAYPDHASSRGSISLVLHYDATTRRLAASIDGHPFAAEHVDLPPRSLARLRFGTNVDKGGNAALSVRRIRVDHERN